MLRLKNGTIKSKKPNNYVVTVSNGARYFDEVFEHFPHGIINKSETGVGATTMELNSKRNSIIVQPLRITAFLKHEKTTGSLYVGSPIKPSQKKVKNSDISDYLSSTMNVGGYKKIICTIDSLPRVMDLIPVSERDQYFLLIDESDALQHDSSFRDSMNVGMDIYKTFKPENRALITATPIEFSDPDLKDEQRITINWNLEPTTKIKHIETNNLYGTVAEKVIELYTESTIKEASGEKFEPIVVAVNHVSNLVELADYLSKNSVNKKDISILCSQSSRSKVGEYWKTMETDQLPNKVVLKTSAYYTGFDINQDYHLIMVSENNDPLNSPSIGRIRQIMGRCRKKLTSCQLIQEFNSSVEPREEFTFETLVENAKNQLKMIDCIKKHLIKGSTFEERIEPIIKDAVSKLEIYGHPLLQIDPLSLDTSINYLGIDGILDTQSTLRSLYSTKEQLTEELGELGLLETSIKTTSSIEVIGTGSRRKFSSTKAMVTDAVEQIRVRFTEIDEVEREFHHPTTDLIFKIVREFAQKYDPDQILKLIEDDYFSKGGLKGLRTLYLKLLFNSEGKESKFRKEIETQFPIGSSFSESEVLIKLSLIQDHNFLDKLPHFGTREKIWLDLFSEFKRTPNVGPKGKRYTKFTILSHNPFDKELKKRPKFSAKHGIAK